MVTVRTEYVFKILDPTAADQLHLQTVKSQCIVLLAGLTHHDILGVNTPVLYGSACITHTLGRAFGFRKKSASVRRDKSRRNVFEAMLWPVKRKEKRLTVRGDSHLGSFSFPSTEKRFFH